jgi:hypothetical protein
MGERAAPPAWQPPPLLLSVLRDTLGITTEQLTPIHGSVVGVQVGMGLNLAIRRVVFTSLSKFDGISERLLTVSEIKQIAGRAGRCGVHRGPPWLPWLALFSSCCGRQTCFSTAVVAP